MTVPLFAPAPAPPPDVGPSPAVLAARASLAAAEEAHRRTAEDVSQARAALLEAERDDWIARARAARPLAEGEAEGWITSTTSWWPEVPPVSYTVLRGRQVARLVERRGAGLVVEVTRQDRGNEGEVRQRVYQNTVAGGTREAREWRAWFGVRV
jgi:hypothetical protein